MARGLRGLESKHEQNMQQILRDTRTLGQRIADFFKNPTAVGIVLIFFALSSFFIPGLTDFLFVIGVIMFLTAYFQKATLPFRMPLRSKMPDYNSPRPGSHKPGKAEGIYFFGNELKTKQELWFTNADMRTHVLVFGSTGSGKTEALVSIAYNSLLQGSGFIYVDGKGDNSLFAKIFSMVRYMGREDDLLLVNFMTGAKDIIGPQKKRLSNTLNPFAVGSSSMLSQLVVSLMESGSKGGSDGDMWKGRAIAFVEALMKILVAMRDAGHILLDANTIRNYFILERIEAMVLDKTFIRDDKEPIALDNIDPIIMEPIKNYLINLPGYNKEKKGKQVSQVLEQHGFITMQLTRVFSSLADTYGHILRTKLAEVDLRDVVLNRRILVVLLPALEKSPDELSNLGKVIIASLKAMMAAGLGDAVEGEYRDLIKRKPTNSPTPYLCILDEYGYYAVQGFAVVPAQARSLGFSVVFAGQDLPAFQKASKEEAASIGANTNIKICMKLEDPLETWEFFSKTAGESYVTHVSGFQTESRGMMNNYMDSKSAQLEKRARVDLLDLKEQREGEMHIFFKSKIVRATAFYADPKPVVRMRLNQFLKIDIPDDHVLHEISNSFANFRGLLNNPLVFGSVQVANDDVVKVTENIHQADSQVPIERGVAALLAFHQALTPQFEEAVEEEMLSETEMNIFEPLRHNPELEALLIREGRQGFENALLNLKFTREQMAYINRLMGQADSDTTKLPITLTKDMQTATHYPPEIYVHFDASEIAATIAEVIAHIHEVKGGGANADLDDLFSD